MPIMYRVDESRLPPGNTGQHRSSFDPPIDSLHEFEIPEYAVPPQISLRLQPEWKELETEGFRNPIFHLVKDVGQRVLYFRATFSHPSNLGCASICYREMISDELQQGPAERSTLENSRP